MPIDPTAHPVLAGLRPGEAGWRAAVDRVLKGRPFETLRTPTRDGFTIEPLYAPRRDAPAIAIRRGASPWTVIQRIDHPNVNDANRLAISDLRGGATGLDLVFTGSPHARGSGIAGDADMAVLLDGVFADLISLRVEAGAASFRRAHAIVDWSVTQGLAPEQLDLTVGADPIGLAVRRGGGQVPLKQALSDAAHEAADLARRLATGPLLSVDGRIWHEAGASRTQTLAAMLATAVADWRALEAAGLSVESAADRIGFTLAVDQDQLSGMAEIRALRLLWARATAAAGLKPALARIHTETSFRMMSRLDAHTNMIRTTIAAFAAGVGGADSVTVLPYTAANGLADTFARRIARNIQLILLEESNLARVSDPAAGAGRIETETRQLAEAAWTLFRAIEAEGGIMSALEAGFMQSVIAETRRSEQADIARRKRLLTGVSAYPNLAAADTPATVPSQFALPSETLSNPLPELQFQRLSEPFEHLRASAVTAALTVFLANLGTVSDFNVRSSWATNLFEVGGIHAIGNDGFENHDDLIAAFEKSGIRAVCVASSDGVYRAEALAIVARLKAAGAGPIFFAGRPGERFQQDSLTKAGVDRFLYAGQDILQTLADAQGLIRSAASGIASGAAAGH